MAHAHTRPDLSPSMLSGVEKVAVLLLALGKQRAAKLLKRFDPDDLKILTRSVGDLRPVTQSDLEHLVEEFAHKFSNGVKFLGTAMEVKDLLTGVMTEDELSEVMSDKLEPVEPVWERISKIKVEVLRAYLIKEHPQTVALILSRLESECAAKVISALPAGLRNGLLCRMLAMKRVGEDAVRAVEDVLREDLIESAASGSHTGIADILNRLDKAQSEDVLKSLAEVRPTDAKALRSLLFTFEELVTLPPRARTVVFDQVPIERLVMALQGTEAEFQSVVLSSLASRSRRMVEAELQGGSTAAARDVAEARRTIVDTVLKMIAKGAIELPEPDVIDELTE